MMQTLMCPLAVAAAAEGICAQLRRLCQGEKGYSGGTEKRPKASRQEITSLWSPAPGRSQARGGSPMTRAY